MTYVYKEKSKRKKYSIPFIDSYLYHINIGEISNYPGKGEVVLAWCYEHIGPEENFVSYIQDFSLIFAFNDAKNAMAFKLRWV